MSVKSIGLGNRPMDAMAYVAERCDEGARAVLVVAVAADGELLAQSYGPITAAEYALLALWLNRHALQVAEGS